MKPTPIMLGQPGQVLITNLGLAGEGSAVGRMVLTANLQLKLPSTSQGTGPGRVKEYDTHKRKQRNMTMKPTKKLVVSNFWLFLTIAGIVIFARPVSAYEQDTHFLMTYAMLVGVGFHPDDALIVAAADQGMDDSKATDALGQPMSVIQEAWMWHALDKDGKMHAKMILGRKETLFQEALNKPDRYLKLLYLGVFFHYQQDTWAHRHHDVPNAIRHSLDHFKTFNTPTGHGPYGHIPDRPPADPVAAIMCLEDGAVYAVRFLRDALNQPPSRSFTATYVPAGGSEDQGWKDKRRGKYFNQIDLRGIADEPSAGLYLNMLLRAQIDSYERGKDANIHYVPHKTPNRAELDIVAKNLQKALNSFATHSVIVETVIPTQEQKAALGFNKFTTASLMSGVGLPGDLRANSGSRGGGQTPTGGN